MGFIPSDEFDADAVAKQFSKPDVTPLLDRIKSGVFLQESGGNYQSRPNPRTKAVGGFQVLPTNIPSWTRKHYGRALTPAQFKASPEAQDAVFSGEMGDYLRQAKAKGVDDDTAIRMGAAAWYGGRGAMHRYDDPTKFRPNEPSFREYTSNVLKKAGNPFDADAVASQFVGKFDPEAVASQFLDVPQQPQPTTPPMTPPQAVLPPEATNIEGMAPIEAPSATPQGMPAQQPIAPQQAVTPPAQQNAAVASPNAQNEAEKQYAEYLKAAGQTDTQQNRDEFTRLMQGSDATANAENQKAQALAQQNQTQYAQQVDQYNQKVAQSKKVGQSGEVRQIQSDVPIAKGQDPRRVTTDATVQMLQNAGYNVSGADVEAADKAGSMTWTPSDLETIAKTGGTMPLVLSPQYIKDALAARERRINDAKLRLEKTVVTGGSLDDAEKSAAQTLNDDELSAIVNDPALGKRIEDQKKQYQDALDFYTKTGARHPEIQAERAVGYSTYAQAEKQYKAADAEKEAYDTWLKETGYDKPDYAAKNSESFQTDKQAVLNQFGSFSKALDAAKEAKKEALANPMSYVLGRLGLDNGTNERAAATNAFTPSSVSDEMFARDRSLAEQFRTSERLNPSPFGIGGLTKSAGTITDWLNGLYKLTLPGLIDTAMTSLTGKKSPLGEMSDAVQKFGKEVKIIGSLSKPDGIIYDFKDFLGEQPGVLTKLAGSTVLAGGNPIIGFGLADALSSVGEGKDAFDTAKATGKGLIMGGIFHGASELAKLVETGALGKLLTSDEAKALLDGDLKGAYGKQAVAKLAQIGTRVGTIGTGTYAAARIEGADHKEALHQAGVMLLTDLAFNYGDFGKLKDLSGKAFRFVKDKEAVDLLVVPDGKGGAEVRDVTGEIPSNAVQAVIPVEESQASIEKRLAQAKINRESYFAKDKEIQGETVPQNDLSQKSGTESKAGQEPSQISASDAVDTIRQDVKESHLDGWFRNGDKSYKPRIVQALNESPNLQNAALNIFHQQYQEVADKPIDFDTFLKTPITLYRGGFLEGNDPFWSFSLDKGIAEGHAKRYGKDTPMHEITVKPGDTYGMMQTTAEGEVLIPSDVVRKQIKGENPETNTAIPQPKSSLGEKPLVQDTQIERRAEDRRKQEIKDYADNERRSAERRVKEETLSTISPEQVLNLAGDKKINDATLDATIEKVTGKKSLTELSPQELLDVSDAIKSGVEPVKENVPEKGFEMKPAEEPTKSEPENVTTNASGESATSQEAINRFASEKKQGLTRVVVDTRKPNAEPRVLTDAQAVDYKPSPYESVEYRGGERNGEVIAQGNDVRPNYSPPSRIEGETVEPKKVEEVTPDTHEIKDEGTSLDDWMKQYGDEPLSQRLDKGESPITLAREAIANEPRTESVNANERTPEARPNSESGTSDTAIKTETIQRPSESVPSKVNAEGVTAEKPVKESGTDGGKLDEAGAKSDVAKDLELFKNNKIVSADRVAQLRAEIAKRQGKLTSGLDPVDLALYTELGAAYIEAGARKFADFSRRMIEDVGDEIKPHLDKIYGNIRQHFDLEGMTPDNRTPLKEGEGVVKVGKSIQQKALEDELINEFGDTAKYDIKGVKEQAAKIADLVTNDEPRMMRMIRGEEPLPKEINVGAFITGVSNSLKYMDDVPRAGKIASELMNSKLAPETSIAGQTLRFLREREPDSVTAYLKQIQDARKERADRQGITKEDVKALDEKINDLEKRLAEKQKASIDKQFEQFINEVKGDQVAAKKKGGSVVDYFNDLEAKARARIDKRGESAIFRSSVTPIDPQMLADHAIIGAAHIARGVKKGVEFGDAMVKQFGEKIRPYLDDLWDASDRFYKANATKSKADLTPEQIIATADGVDRKLINSLVTARIKQGDTSVDKVFTEVTKDIQSKYPEISEQEIRDTFTGYGENKVPKRNDLLRKRNEIQRLQKLQSQIDDVNAGKKPWRPEQKGQTKSEYVKAKERELEQAMAEAGITMERTVTDAERLATRKRAMQRELGKIETALSRGNYTKPERRTTILDAEGQKIHSELQKAREARTALGHTVNADEAETLLHLLRAVDEGRTAMENGGDRKTTYGAAKVALDNYVNDLKLDAKRYTLAEFKKNPAGGVAKLLNAMASNTKAIAASMDDSAVFRQGWKTMLTHPTIWAKNGIKTFRHLIKMRGQHEVMDALNADIVSRPTYEQMKKAGLDIGVNEETFPTTLPEHIPVVGRVYKATENAYTAFVRKTRADVFDKYIDIANKTGVELTDTELKGIGRMVNALTGRGDLGTLEQAGKVVNNVFFSPKFLKSHFDVLGGHVLTGGGEGSNFVRKQAAINLVKVVGGTAAILLIAKAINPDSVDFDPRSANFGKIRSGNTTFDVSGGMGSILTLAARLALQQTKSSVTGKVYNLGEKDKNGKLKFGAQTSFDVGVDFLTNKTSPLAHVLVDYGKGETFDREKPTLAREGMSLITPLPIKTGQELWKDPHSAPFLVGLIADLMGISTNTYGGSKGVLRDMQKAKARGDYKEVQRLKPILTEELKIEAAAKKQRIADNK